MLDKQRIWRNGQVFGDVVSHAALHYRILLQGRNHSVAISCLELVKALIG
jgi:hypothetical protein